MCNALLGFKYANGKVTNGKQIKNWREQQKYEWLQCLSFQSIICLFKFAQHFVCKLIICTPISYILYFVMCWVFDSVAQFKIFLPFYKL